MGVEMDLLLRVAAGVVGFVLNMFLVFALGGDVLSRPSLLSSAFVAQVLMYRMTAALPKEGANPRLKNVTLLAVLGSGGHTTEMFYDLETLQDNRVVRHYVVADTDSGSGKKADLFESNATKTQCTATKHIVPRAREVGQSYVTSIFTTLRASVTSFAIVFKVMPDVIVCNGPGTCVPIAVAAYFLRFFGIKRVFLIYSESMACVAHLSMSGRILYHFADHFTVQWSGLLASLGKAKYAGRCREGLPLQKNSINGDGTAVVTVGSTKFEELIKHIDSLEVLTALRSKGIKQVVVQKGNGVYYPDNIAGEADVEVMEYSQQVPQMLKTASIVISHAGAGTVLDCLLSDRELLIVPNETLMANHQVQLAEELGRYDLVQWCHAPNLLEELQVWLVS